ncbi:dihydrolipoyllysine-residue succinyltransferase [Haloferula sp.]|uniref:dihydrolipoyllysine-residue succinyltransferase n=1 Tax=Haloferula sp. TaxID=2497595 RepID=UPI00329C63C2
MPTQVKVPAAGESITSANVAQWHKKDGEAVDKGDVLVTLETDKVSNELVADVAGQLKVIVAEGEEVAIGTVIGEIDESQSVPAEKAADQKPLEEAPAPSKEPVADAKSESAGGEVIDVKVPAAGESITSANVAAWRKKDGDAIAKGEVLVTLETDKVSSELEAEESGVLEIVVPEGEEVSIGTIIARITVGDVPAQESKEPAEAPAAAPKEAPKKEAPKSQPKPDFTLPVAAKKKEDLAPVTEGRTTRKKMSMLRRKIATHLVNAQQSAAILTTFNEADMSAVMGLRKEVQEEFIKKHGVKLGFMSFFVKAVVQALKDVPAVNGQIDGNEIVQNHFYDVGVAIGTEKGLVVPVLRDCADKGFAEIEKDILNYAEKARDGKMQIEDLQGGVFTISNGGTYGSLLSTPILNPPQSGILGMHTIQKRPVAIDGKVEIRPMMYLALSYDHRLVDGKEAVTFLIRIKDCIENPTRLMLDM